MSLTSSVVQPRLVALGFREPPVGTTNSDVQDQEEILIEGRSVGAVLPRVAQGRQRLAIEDGRGPLGTIKEWLVKPEIEQGVQPRVHVDAEELGSPFQSVCVEVVSERGTLV